MSEKIVLIDGHSILNRAFYGIPDLTNAEGLHTNAVYGFLNILFKILEEEQAGYLAVAFDLKAPTFRHKMYEAYKGTRKPMPEELREQVPVIKEVLQAMGIPIITKEGYEADDILGTLSVKAEKEGMEVTILSGDRDLLQLATDHIQIRIPKTKRTGTEVENYYAADVKERYLVTPAEFIDVKALMGDTSDNIPGIPGVGEKTATKIIAQYGSIENAYAHVEEIKPNKAKESLKEHYDLAQLSKALAAINKESPVSLDLEQAEIKNLYTKEAFAWFKRLEFKNMLSRFQTEELPLEQAETYVRITEFSDAAEIFAKAEQAENLGFQCILEGKQMVGLALAFEKGTAYWIAAGGFITEGYLTDAIREVLLKDCQAASFDLKEQLHVLQLPEQKNIWDLSVGAYLINPLKNGYTYDDISNEYLGRMIPSKEELLGKTGFAKAEETMPEKMTECACRMALTAYEAKEPVLKKVEDYGMMDLYRDVEMPLVYTLCDMEEAGIQVNAEELKAYGEQLSVRITQLEQQIYEEAGEAFNINSPKQLGVLLFEKLKLPYGKKTKTGYSTAADVLEKLAPESQLVTDILEYRTLSKLKSTYADGLAGYIGEDGRIHGKFHQTITATGRISSTEPNLRNIPVRTELGRLLRKVFIPKKDSVFVDADYSQIELRVLAHFSGDEHLIKAYQEAADIHRITASQVFHIPFEEVTDLQRRNAKAVNFGIVYGISSFGLSQGLSITRKEAGEYIERYFETYPGIKAFLDGEVEKAKTEGYVSTLFGRRRPVPELKSSNFMQRSFGERVAMNAPVQGTAADIIKIAMIRVNKRLKEETANSRLVLQIHDELLVETDERETAQVQKILEEEMTGAAHLAVRLEIDMHTGKNWYEAK